MPSFYYYYYFVSCSLLRTVLFMLRFGTCIWTIHRSPTNNAFSTIGGRRLSGMFHLFRGKQNTVQLAQDRDYYVLYYYLGCAQCQTARTKMDLIPMFNFGQRKIDTLIPDFGCPVQSHFPYGGTYSYRWRSIRQSHLSQKCKEREETSVRLSV